MNLQCRTDYAKDYKGGSQIARVLSEDWCARELYCPACESDKLTASRANAPAIDFTCPRCEQPFQLKSLRKWDPKKIVDAGYEAMVRAIRNDQTPNLLVLQYSSTWLVNNLIIISKFFFSESAIEKRAPLSMNARRAGWIGCNILLGQIPSDGKIEMVSNGVALPTGHVRQEFSRLRTLAVLPPSLRGWTLDVLNVIRRLGKSELSLSEIYAFEQELKGLHPKNENIRPKIRQQLQILRDMGFLRFAGPGKYNVIG